MWDMHVQPRKSHENLIPSWGDLIGWLCMMYSCVCVDVGVWFELCLHVPARLSGYRCSLCRITHLWNKELPAVSRNFGLAEFTNELVRIHAAKQIQASSSFSWMKGISDSAQGSRQNKISVYFFFLHRIVDGPCILLSFPVTFVSAPWMCHTHVPKRFMFNLGNKLLEIWAIIPRFPPHSILSMPTQKWR